MICTIIGAGEGVNKVDKFLGYTIGLNHVYKYVDVDCTVMFDNPTIVNKTIPNLHTLAHYKKGTGYINRGREINYNKGEVGNFNLSVIMAVNVAIHLGYTEMYLLGCENRIDDKTHFYSKNKATKTELDFYNARFKTNVKMWSQVEVKKGERLIFVDSDISKFENITVEEYNKKGAAN